MRSCKRTVKRLDAEFVGVLFETTRIHQRNCAEPAHIGVVQSSAVIQLEPQSRIIELVSVKVSVVDQESSRETRLYDEPIAGVQIDYHELGPTPAADDCRVLKASGE